MWHKIMLVLQDFFGNNSVLFSGITELDEIFVLDCYKGSQVLEAGCSVRKHGAKAAKRGISNEYIAINTGIQRDSGAVAATVKHAKPSGAELDRNFRGTL